MKHPKTSHSPQTVQFLVKVLVRSKLPMIHLFQLSLVHYSKPLQVEIPLRKIPDLVDLGINQINMMELPIGMIICVILKRSQSGMDGTRMRRQHNCL